MGVAACGANTEILQFDWFMSGRMFPVLPVQGGFKKPLFRLKITILGKIGSQSVSRTIRKRKVTMDSEGGEEILYQMTELHVVTVWHPIPLHLSIVFR